MMHNLRPFALERYFAQYEFHVRYMLCGSDCESVTVEELLALEPGARDRLNQLWLGYTESPGSPTLRGAIASVYQNIAPENVLVHSGAEEAILTFMNAALAPGDHLIVHAPCYQSLYEIALNNGVEVSAWQAKPRDWSLDLEVLRALIRPNTKAVVINTPHNPSGYLMPRDLFQRVCALCDQRGIPLFSDEVYRESEHEVSDRLPAACDLGVRHVSLGVMSKTYGLPGLRIGWVASRNAKLLARMAELKDYTTICNSAPSELLAEVALRNRGAIVSRNLSIIRPNLKQLDEFMNRHRDLFAWVKPRAGCIAFPRLLKGDVEQFCDSVVKGCGVLLLPGTMYGDADNCFRIGFGRRNFPEALAHFEEYLVSNKARLAA